ncbi:hypothetical protein J2S43_001553 [Catenuloplanes nepalensis]|uniref:Uncharacterized protein n=1 Tax=Catenuloplanes nepalensis TaxID=587533 RepID=A0ABT9MPQ3_9ACTN|nr:hypothetical protein [Catenuloplanes nepalensis]MDP9793041.1 hypothetical protein [Catenuloplanes nepalensis]
MIPPRHRGRKRTGLPGSRRDGARKDPACRYGSELRGARWFARQDGAERRISARRSAASCSPTCWPARTTWWTRTAQRLREQISLLTTELARIDRELADLTTTRTTLKTIASAEFTTEEPTVISSAYQQILAVLGTAPDGMRATDI